MFKDFNILYVATSTSFPEASVRPFSLGRTVLLAGGLLAASCSPEMTPPYLDIRNPDKAAIVGRIVDGRQVVLAARHVERMGYRHWYHPMVWPKDCPLSDPAIRVQWSNAAWRILE